MLRKGDFFLIGIAIVLIAASFIGVSIYKGAEEDTKKIAVIKQDDKEVKRIDLDTVNEPLEIKISGAYDETILVEKGRIRFKEADCPDKVCVKTGWLSSKGDMAVCLPNRTMIKIEGQSKDVDIVTY